MTVRYFHRKVLAFFLKKSPPHLKIQGILATKPPWFGGFDQKNGPGLQNHFFDPSYMKILAPCAEFLVLLSMIAIKPRLSAFDIRLYYFQDKNNIVHNRLDFIFVLISSSKTLKLRQISMKKAEFQQLKHQQSMFCNYQRL